MDPNTEQARAEPQADYTEQLDGSAIQYLFDIGGRGVRLVCRVVGQVITRRAMKNVVFLVLDTTAPLQLVLDKSRLGDADFDRAAEVRVNSRLEATVEPEYVEDRQPPVRLVVRRFSSSQTASIIAPGSDIDADQARAKLELARVARGAANYLLGQGFDEVAPLTISTASAAGVEPLHVLFPGLGAENSLVVSPFPQLVEVAELTGTAKVFSISRLYSRVIRDGFTSSESLVVVSVQLRAGGDEDPQLDFVEELIRAAAQAVRGRLSPQDRVWMSASWLKAYLRTPVTIGEISSPTHQLTKSHGRTVFRSAWPRPLALAEGHVRPIGDSTIHCTTIHCERILHLVRDTHFRRIHDGPHLDRARMES